MNFMTIDKVKFLTKKNFDINFLIEILKKKSNTLQTDEDQKIINDVIKLFEKNDHTLLSPQEIHFLKSTNGSFENLREVYNLVIFFHNLITHTQIMIPEIVFRF